MFVLVLIDDNIAIKPDQFRFDTREQLKRRIQQKYVDRVIPNVGLCIEFYDFVRIKDAIIYPGDGNKSLGEAYFKVEFNLIVFRPAVDEWLTGSIAGSYEWGIRVSLGFFHDVSIPSTNLRVPYVFDPTCKQWVWQYRNTETREVINFFYEKDELIRFRVVDLKFPLASRPENKDCPMEVIGSVDRDGLGCVSWWPDTTEPPQAAADGATSAAADVKG
eukprot:gnl/TRDRNA2_/TRDRNA2_28582_c0_seq1.p1 gnl/TRDRNA2_/TRDRNA2_28582_c0~~gnl/TRDRNA2_/TRDRNA2_28582_c0_seq1.p1  ORF type:complete len:218 (+),score=36.07 gnl/TRDRNA2_/TRDRNA2_28582_c0_seq1:66-719(+)